MRVQWIWIQGAGHALLLHPLYFSWVTLTSLLWMHGGVIEGFSCFRPAHMTGNTFVVALALSFFQNPTELPSTGNIFHLHLP